MASQDLAPAQVQGVLHRFYESFFPLPSQFELSPGQVNPVLYLDPLRKHLGLPSLSHNPPPRYPSSGASFGGDFDALSQHWRRLAVLLSLLVILSIVVVLHLLGLLPATTLQWSECCAVRSQSHAASSPAVALGTADGRLGRTGKSSGAGGNSQEGTGGSGRRKRG